MTNWKEHTITLTPKQHMVFKWMEGKSPFTESEAMQNGVGRLGVSRQLLHDTLSILVKAGLVKQKSSSRIMNTGIGRAAATGRKVKVKEYVVIA